MKKIMLFIALLLLVVEGKSQTNIPQLVSFSAVVRDVTNQPLVSTSISLRLSFRQGGQTGSIVYCALHQDQTNENGFISVQLNRNVLATQCNGATNTSFETIPWQNGNFWLEIEYQTDPTANFINLGQIELASSFYAFSAGTAERLVNFNLNGASNGDVLVYDAVTSTWKPQTPSVSVSEMFNFTPRIASQGQQLSISFTGGDQVSFSQSSSTCPSVYNSVALFNQASSTILFAQDVFLVNSKRIDATFQLPYQGDDFNGGMWSDYVNPLNGYNYAIPYGLYDVVIGYGTACEFRLNSSFKFFGN